MVKVNVLRPADPAWNTCLRSARNDIYHQAGYHAFEESLGHGDGYLVLVEEGSKGLVWPYLLQPVDPATGGESGHTDVGSVYGYPGPLTWGVGHGDPFLESAWAELRAVWREQRAVTAFTRFHPLLDNASLAVGLSSGTRVLRTEEGVVTHGATISVDCSLSDEEVFATYHRSLRQHLRVSRRKGMATEEDTNWHELETFSAIYLETMSRNRAADYYLFSNEDFAQLRDALPGQVHLLVTRFEGEVAAAGIFTELDGIVEAHLVASRAVFKQLSPTKMLLDDARRWARERGDRVLHLGGGRGNREDSLFRFKSEFSSRRHAFYTGRWVLDEANYRSLIAANAANSSVPFDGTYFPAYRAPMTQLETVSAERSTPSHG